MIVSLEQNQALARQFTEQVFNQGNLALIDEIFSETYINHSAPPNLPRGKAGTKAFVTMFRAAFPDLHITIEDIIAEGDRVAVRHTTHGTNTGSFMGMPPTGKQVHVSGIDWVRIQDGKIVEGWGLFDQAGMMQQLGAGAPH